MRELTTDEARAILASKEKGKLGPGGEMRVCPPRDAICPHGFYCPFNKGWNCDMEASRAILRAKEDRDAR